MTELSTAVSLIHDELGLLPARRVLDCVFALSPAGSILHYHLGQLSAVDEEGRTHYRVQDPNGAPDRARCRIIPPLVREFSR